MARSTNWKFYFSSEQTWEGMYQACEQARFSIDLEQYIFVDDFLGRRFFELFLKKARSGVKIRLLLDWIGSYSMRSSPALAELRQAGVQVQFFNPISLGWILPYRITERFLRTHRKLLITDGEHGFIGGVGIRADMRGRRDTHVRVTGPVVDEMAAAFQRIWEMTTAGRRIFTFQKPLTETSNFFLLTNSPRYRQRFTYWTLVRRIRTAKQYIYLTTPYFVPDWRIFRALRGAARRGVEVRLILPRRSDNRIVDAAARSFFARALRVGIRIFEHQLPGTRDFIHAKTCLIDDELAIVGSSNLDTLSLLLNYEADLGSTDPKFIREVKWQVIEDINRSHEVTRASWRERSWFAQWLELITWPLHRFL